MLGRWATFGGDEVTPLARLVAFLAFTAGVVAFAWRPNPLAACALILPLRVGAALLSSRIRWRRVLGWACFAGVVTFYGAAFAAAVLWGVLLAWTLPAWVLVVTVLTAVLVLAGPRLPGRVRWPVLLPLG